MVLPAVRSSSAWTCTVCRAHRTALESARRSFSSQTIASQQIRKIPEFPARTRFAPSPTGYLHLGSLRTALYNYLLAKATGGQFLLRIEDTDQSRTVPDAQERICRDLEWAGLQWDEGPEIGGPYGPYIQSERMPMYREHAKKLLDSGHAYRCFCTAQRLNELATIRSKLGLPTDYDRTCAGISREESDDRASKGESYSIRLKAPATYPAFNDVIYGWIGKAKKETKKFVHGEQVFEDPILLKSDGRPTYHLANVVDDHYMKITHVVRAVEWTPSTPKHVYLYQAFGWTPPAFAHVGLLQGANNQKLSKRSGDIDVGSYRRNGVFPEALINFVALLGWHHKQKNDVMNLRELISNFDLSFTKGNTVVNFPKLDFLSREYSKRYTRQEGLQYEEMLRKAIATLEQHGIVRAPEGKDLQEYVSLILKADPTSYTDLAGFAERHQSFFEWREKDVAAQNALPSSEAIATTKKHLNALPEDKWSEFSIGEILRQIVSSSSTDAPKANETKLRMSELLSDLRTAILGGKRGPGMAASMEILGRSETLSRLNNAEEFLRRQS